jgi:nitroimidazol reductase NimA-like FMN-containing flavoprotein (pyridoxamine 5'-phosphate oxidase superfamily)
MKPLPDALGKFVADSPVCRIATVRDDGAPHLIPVCPVFDGESTVYVDIGDRSASAQGVRKSGDVAVLVDHYEDDWSQLKAALLYCRAEIVKGDEQDRAWAMIREKFPQHSTVSWEPRLTLALRINDWRQWGVFD